MLFPAENHALHTGSLYWETAAPRRLLALAALLAALVPAALFLDLPLQQFCAAGRLPGDLRRVLTWSEVFAHGVGVLILATTVFLLDPSHRRQVPRLVATALGAGLVADLVKLTVARVRPAHFTGDRLVETFAGWLPVFWPIDGYERLDHRLQSFPSAHSAVAVGLAAGLAAVYPRGRYLFLVFAILAAAQRMESGSHYLSDTLAGAAVGCAVAATLAGRGGLARLFDRFENLNQPQGAS
jgi:membrane-associated phospholipid phosphatase